MNLKRILLCALALTLPLAVAKAQPNDTGAHIYANLPDPLLLAFAPDGSLYVGRDNSGSGGGGNDAVRIHRIGPGGATVSEFGNLAISDPDAVIVDTAGTVSGIPGAVLVGGVHSNGPSGKISRISPDGTVVTLFGPDNSLANPNAFAFDANGRLLITEWNNGSVLVTTGGPPTVLFFLSRARNIAVDTLNRIAVCTSSDAQLRLYGSDGTLLNANFATVKTNSPLVSGPGGIWGRDIYAVALNGDLIRIGLDGTITKMGSGLGAMFSLAFGPDGMLYGSRFDKDRIYRFAPPTVPGTETTVYARITDPARLSFAPDGTLFVGRDNSGSGGGLTDPVKIQRIGPGGSPVGEYGDAAISDPDAVFFDATGQFSGVPGSVIVGGTENPGPQGKLVKILPSGTVAPLFGPTTFGFNPNCIVFDPAGRLLLNDDHSHRVWTMTNTTPVPLFTLTNNSFLAVDALGRIVIGAQDAWLRLYSANGQLLNRTYAQVPTDTLSPLACGPGGFWGTDLYFIGTNWNLMRLATNGVVTEAGLSFGLMQDLAFGPDGALYVSELNTDSIWRIAPVPPVLSAISDAATLQLSWHTAVGPRYQLQSATSLSATNWLSEGPPFPGTGGVLSTNLPIGPEPARFFRLRLSN